MNRVSEMRMKQDNSSRIYEANPGLTSVVSHPTRCKLWGDAGYRGKRSARWLTPGRPHPSGRQHGIALCLGLQISVGRLRATLEGPLPGPTKVFLLPAFLGQVFS